MVGRILIGVLIGLVAGFLMSKKGIQEKENSSNAIHIFLTIIAIAFIGSSFMYGAIFGLMAIGEIIFGFVVVSGLLSKRQAIS